MNLSATQMTLIFAGCIVAIGGILVLWRRGVFTPKTTTATTSDQAAK